MTPTYSYPGGFFRERRIKMPQYSIWPFVPHLVGSGSEKEVTHYLDWMVCTVACRVTSLPKQCLWARCGLWAPLASAETESPTEQVSLRCPLLWGTCTSAAAQW